LDGWRVEKHTWDFTEDKPLVGVYGETSERGIEKLGMIRLNLACQAAHDETQPFEEVATDVTEEQMEEETTDEKVEIDFKPIEDTFVVEEEEVTPETTETTETTEVTEENATIPDETVKEETTDENEEEILVAPTTPDINDEALIEVETPEEKKGLSTFTWLIIVFGSIGFIVLVVVTVIALKRGLVGKNIDDRETAPSITRRSQQQEKATNDLEKSEVTLG